MDESPATQNPNPPPSMRIVHGWSSDKVDLLRQWKSEAIARASVHHHMARIHRICDRICGTFEVMLTAVATAIVFLTLPGESSPICAGSGVHAQWIMIAAGVSSALALCAIGVDNVFHFSCMTEKHGRAKSRLSGFVRYVDETLRIDPMTRGGAEHALTLVRRRIDNITDDAPFVRFETTAAPTPKMMSAVRNAMASRAAEGEFECAADEMSGALAATASGSAFTGDSLSSRTPIRSPFGTPFCEDATAGTTPDRRLCFNGECPAASIGQNHAFNTDEIL